MDDPEFQVALRNLRCSSNKLCVPYFGEWDLPAKRNYALWYARRHRFSRILLLDDDIRGFQATALAAGANALHAFVISGFFVDDFPDTSAIGHVEIESGELVWTFLSGSCLFVRADGDLGFFPPIYNEDWLFMIPHIAHWLVSSLGAIRQKPYDPFSRSSVARFQEFGEIIADGLLALVASGRYHERLNCDTWRQLLRLHRDWLAKLAIGISHNRHRAIVDAALTKSAEVTERDCVRFVRDWEADRELWNQTLREFN